MLARLVLEHAHELDMLEWRSAQRQEMADEVRRHERKMIDLRSDSRLKTIMQRTVWERELRNAPFELTPLQVRDRVMDAGGGGRRPVLIPVPLRVVGSGTSDLPDLRELIRRAWYRQPWQEDMVVLDGLVTRPLERTDTDVQTIHRALYGLPVVMIYGQFNRYSELELEVATWGLAEGLDTSVLQLRLPPAVFPSVGTSTKSDQGDVEDQIDAARVCRGFEEEIGQLCAIVAGACAEWFHVTNAGRRPRLHTLIPATWEVPRKTLAIYGASILKESAERLGLSSAAVMMNQAAVFAEGGLPDLSLAVLSDAIATSRSEVDQEGTRLRELAVALRNLCLAIPRLPDSEHRKTLVADAGNAVAELRERSLRVFFGVVG